ncbi:cache domain-containing protein [Methanolobus sp.]|jgi:mannose-6-phosphate isomerase-like protein (cupin superfamily)|uniref:cache domain-containing protein n=1 Tax=Methanolobus sp. TaxID=1874737 RepID=UPI0025F3DE28|nr:cache domain-containing protein [Methanolobus sp.]
MNLPKIILSVLLISALLLAAAGCVEPDGTSICTVENQTDEAGEEQTELSSQEEYTISQVNAAIDLIEEKGETAFPDFRENNSTWFHDDFYIFVWKTNGIRVVYPPDTSGEGQDMNDLEDFNGKSIGSVFIETALSEDGKGWVDYYWPKPGETEPSLKHTFIKNTSIGNEKYLVGSGFYVDDYVYSENINEMQHFTRFGNVSLGNLLHPATTDMDLGVNYSIAHVIIKPGGSIESHLMKNPEAHYVLAGEGILYIENVSFELSEGQIVLIPANAKQSTVNTGDTDLEFLAIDQPAWAEENEEVLE